MLALASQTHLKLAQSTGTAEYTNCIPAYDTKLSDGEAPLMLELWGMRGTLSLPSLSGLLWPGI